MANASLRLGGLQEVTEAEVASAARFIACLRCLRRAKSYDFTRHLEIERLLALAADALGMADDGLYIFIPPDQVVHPYPMHILAKRMPKLPRREGRSTHVIVEARPVDDDHAPMTREILEGKLVRGQHGLLDKPEAFTDPRFGDRITSQVFFEHAPHFWPLAKDNPKAGVVRLAWAALYYEGLQRSERSSARMAELRGEKEKIPLGALVIQPGPGEPLVRFEMKGRQGKRWREHLTGNAEKVVSIDRIDLEDAPSVMGLVWPTKVLRRALTLARRLEPEVRYLPRCVPFAFLQRRGKATLTEHLAYYLVEEVTGPQLTLQEAASALGMRSRQAVSRAIRDRHRKCGTRRRSRT